MVLIGLGLLVLVGVVWIVSGVVRRAALVRSAEARPPVRGTPLTGGMDMSFVPPTAVPRQEGPQPRLLLSEKEHRLGVLPINGPPAEYTFRVINIGAADLEITALTTSCGCTTARLSAQRIPPGESAELIVQFDPGFHRQPGNYVREVYLFTNDPRQPRAVVTISAATY